MGFLKEFKEFAMKGNVMDMAVGVIIGGAFGKIVSSLVSDVLMPIVSLCTGGVDFTNLFVQLGGSEKYDTVAAAQEAGASIIAYGQFIQNIVDFICVALCVFLMIKAMNKLNKKKEEAPAPEPPAPSAEETLLTEIRDLLKNK
ncbi:MAG: large conductance mechanosensitive channel protein MscL [Bacteroidaceae bacterium]|nr:large conductance mechanosensitive channel protein MscL [Bacteroidaceae bacterium]MBR1940961.1 large conductance mechanosensitive channel protein MscL [Bacteroidaceae bacterium]MBR2160975.1 large conductance mechanosensitive channel protein MscL [Bacteroidaceae bacterium]MBR3626565.1 large conductance mechanosensitive channel protein MscL [Bacteroidaceae bacterium]